METAVHNQIYPPMDKRPIPASTSFIAELRSSHLPDPRPSSAEPKAKHCIRGDSYLGGMDQMDKLVTNLRDPKLSDDELEKQLQMRLMLAAAHSYAPPPHTFGPVVVVSSYTQFSNLAHGPRGTEATRSMRSYRLNISDGSLTLLSVTGEGAIHNPAFSRCHPKLNVIYACTESVKQEGQVVTLALDGKSGALREHCPPVGAGGTSTCFLTIHHGCRRMLLVNYWDSTICTIRMEPDGRLGGVMATYDPKQGRKMKACAENHVNHSRNDAAAQAERQGDPHSHAIVLEPSRGNMAFVPDLGMDVIRQFHFDEETGVVTPCGEMVSGVKVDGLSLGPRYMCFHQGRHVCYVVNELSSQVAVFQYHPEVASEIDSIFARTAPQLRAELLRSCKPTLSLVQTVSTLPSAFPRELNTCGRVAIHPSGDFVLTSNRGHDSVAVHRIHRDSSPAGLVTLAGIFHTRGETPRHFQFDKSGQWLIVANQDSDDCAVFNFNCSTGQVAFTGNSFKCPSPNFVCVWNGA
jgi:6-phosphogluconolactonase (cycloisomerase 2 family)